VLDFIVQVIKDFAHYFKIFKPLGASPPLQKTRKTGASITELRK
jgi:hypothetical protein